MLQLIYRNKWLAGCIALVIISTFLVLFNLGDKAFWDYDEAIYAQVTKETAVRGNFLTLHWLSNPWFEKPPLYYWLAIGAERMFQDDEFSYRLPSALTGIASVVLTMLIAFAITRNYPITFSAGLVLLTSPTFFEAARQVRLDVPVTMAILFAFYSFIRASDNPRWYIGAGVGAAAAVMTKSVIGLLMGPIILIWAAVHRSFAWLKKGYLWIAAAIAAVLILPWHIYETLKYGWDFWSIYLGTHVLGRFEGTILGGGTDTNINYINSLLTFALPWSVVTVLGVIPLYLMWRSNAPYFKIAFALCLQIIFLIAVFFTAGTKIPYYLTPIYPFCALFIAIVGVSSYESLANKYRPIFLTVAGVIVVAAIAQTINVGFHFHNKLERNDRFAYDERNIGLTLKDAESLPLYAYKYGFWDTITYYGDRKLQMMQDDQLLGEPFYLVIPRQLHDVDPFPPELAVRFMPLYVGEAVVLLRFDLTPQLQE